ncbi:MAG TPA: hypothetical protein VH575_17185 [Gemmataceae bacterium]|jgi:hypothetical protein
MRRSQFLSRLYRAVPALIIAALAMTLIVFLFRPALVSGRQQGAPELLRASHNPYPMPAELAGVDLSRQTAADAARKSGGCVHCHQNTHDPHFKDTVHLGCVDCHGGDPDAATKELAHVLPSHAEAWLSSANPVRSYTLLNHERPEFIRFVNPGDLRIAHISCGTSGCHSREVLQNRMSMMTHGCMLWGAALYNNGSVPDKWARYGESYSMNGVPQRLQTVPPPTPEEIRCKGVRPFLDPLPRFEITQPGNILRIFERGGRFRTETGIPELTDDPGRPRSRLGDRGLGTQNRTDPTFLGLQKTRLFDPTLNFLGTNDHAGDYRSSGCSACHVLYANDRSRVHSGPYAVYGNRGLSYSPDPTIPKDQPGHPIAHRFVPGNGMPTSQCIVCHVHPGTNVLNSYLGFMWWDEETDGELIYPKKQKHPTAEEFVQSQLANPNESAVRNNLSDPVFLERLVELNSQAKHTQFADFHGHGWAFRAVFKQDRQGNLLDHRGKVIEHAGTAELMTALRYQKLPPQERKAKDGVPVHLMDVHLEKGMHCVDCHFIQDAHGNTRLQGEVRAGIEIQCIDCHGTIAQRATLRTTGPAAYTSSRKGGRNLEELRTPFGKRRFEREGDKIYQNSMVEKDLRWELVQTQDTITPGSDHYNEKARLAKTVRFDSDGRLAWGDVPPQGEKGCAHCNSNMTCIACHTSWNPSCYGCHLPQRANMKMPSLHNEGDVSRNYISYNFQTLRDEVFMLARDGDVTGNRICPSRSSCAVEVSSFNANREAVYFQQQTISSGGLSGIAFSTNVPHTVRGRDATKQCSDCHVSKDNDNNAILAQLLMQGTNYLNFMGRNCWVAAGEHGLEAVVVTELEEPQAVIGSTLHHLAFPDFFEEHLKHHRELRHGHRHPGKGIGDTFLHPFRKEPVLAVQQRGEYVYAACGAGGLRVYDIAFIDDKGFSERIVTAPVSPLGQRFYVPTRYATSVAAPTTIAPDPTRAQRPENREAAVHAIYGYLFVTDKYEGLILVGAGTVLDGNPLNNFLKRELTFNPDGLLNGAISCAIVGTYAYVCCDAGLVVINLNDPKHPVVTDVLGKDLLHHPKTLAAQFRYGFAIDDDGLKVLDMLNLAHPKPIVKMALPEVNSIYVARTRAYLAGGSHGLIIVDVENPEKPHVEEVYTAEGEINDLRDVKLGITYSSEFAYLADGKNGLRVVQLTSPETPGNGGFSPKPKPELIATYKFDKGAEALCVSKALDRDRAVDESGNPIAVFGRVGARPLTVDEQRKLYLHDGRIWRVSDDPNDPIYPRPCPPSVPSRH